MKKEYFVILAVAFFILSYVLDLLGGSVSLPLKNPFELLTQQMLSTYPFTVVSIAFKTSAIFISVLILLTFFDKKYLAKGAFLVFLAAMMELYSIQQLATGSINLPVVWSVAVSHSGIILLAPGVIYLIIGFIKIIHHNIALSSDEPIQENHNSN